MRSTLQSAAREIGKGRGREKTEKEKKEREEERKVSQLSVEFPFSLSLFNFLFRVPSAMGSDPNYDIIERVVRYAQVCFAAVAL